MFVLKVSAWSAWLCTIQRPNGNTTFYLKPSIKAIFTKLAPSQRRSLNCLVIKPPSTIPYLLSKCISWQNTILHLLVKCTSRQTFSGEGEVGGLLENLFLNWSCDCSSCAWAWVQVAKIHMYYQVLCHSPMIKCVLRQKICINRLFCKNL